MTALRQNERELAEWIEMLRRYKGLGTHELLCSRFEQENPGFIWDPLAEKNEERIQAVHSFLKLHGRLPKRRGEHEHEEKLAKWMALRRMDKKRGVNEGLTKRLDAEFPNWTSAVHAESMFEMLRNFKAAYGEMPRNLNKTPL